MHGFWGGVGTEQRLQDNNFHTDRGFSLMCAGDGSAHCPDTGGSASGGSASGWFTCSGVGTMGVSLGSEAVMGRGVVCWLESPR